MDKETVLEVMSCLPEDRTVFHYYRDRYAFLLLSHAQKQRHSIAELRNSRFAQLLDKPAVKQHLASFGSSVTDWSTELNWPETGVTDYVLTLGMWGDPKDRRTSQTSRSGYNLVLQLNFCNGAMDQFGRLVEYPRDYNFSEHPTCTKPGADYRETLAWARMDVDFDTDEVLIEEIQSDFVRYVEWMASRHNDHSAVAAFVRPYKVVWQEAMMAAALEFIWNELGVRTIYYHEHRTGSAMKNIRYRKPPRSLYERLPRKFCMLKEPRVPKFLAEDRYAKRVLRRVDAPKFYVLEDEAGS